MATHLYIDSDHLHLSAQALLRSLDLTPNFWMDFAELRQAVAGGDTLGFARAYGSKLAPYFGCRQFVSKRMWTNARREGFEACQFDHSFDATQAKLQMVPKEVKTGLVADLVADAIVDYAPGDIAVVVAGDRDYLPAVMRLKKEGVTVVVAFWESQVDQRLADAASRFIPLERCFGMLCKAPSTAKAETEEELAAET